MCTTNCPMPFSVCNMLCERLLSANWRSTDCATRLVHHAGCFDLRLARSCLVLHNNQQTSSSDHVEYHANGGGGSWHANRCTPGQLSFEGSWILLLNNNSRKLVPINDSSDSKWVAQPSRRCPYCPEFVWFALVLLSTATKPIWSGLMPTCPVTIL